VPTFCRHNHLIQNCPICAREQDVDLRPIVSSGTPKSAQTRSSRPTSESGRSAGSTRVRPGAPRTAARAGGGVRVSQLARGADDGYRSQLVPGLKSSDDAERLAEELAFAAARLVTLATDPPGLYAEVADAVGDLEERTWLAFLIAYLGPLDGEEPFAAIEAVRVPWAAADSLALDGVQTGPRGVYDHERGLRTVDAYRAWAARSGSQATAFTGELAWAPQRRFARVYERLALPGFPRDGRFELLSTLGRLGVYGLEAGALQLGGSDSVTTAAKRVLGIGDSLLLERRAADLAGACELPLEALDVGLYNWERGSRATLGLPAEAGPDPVTLDSIRGRLGL
jgi:hypothetical protein